MGMEVDKIKGSDVAVLNNNNVSSVEKNEKEENISELLSNPIADKTQEKEAIKKTDKSKNGKFDISEVIKNIGKGLISPLTALINHPILSVGILMGTVYACMLAPVLTPILTAGFGLYSIYQIGKGIFDAVENYKNGKYDDAEKSFETVGQGIIGTILSAMAIKPSAKIVREAKLLSNGEKITPEISPQLLKSGFLTNLKETGSLFVTKNGIKAINSQLKLSSIKASFKEGVLSKILRQEKGKLVKKEEKITREISLKEKIDHFKQTAEGIRRENLSDEQIEQEVLSMSEKIFDKFGIPKEQRPQVKIINEESQLSGCYNNRTHIVEFYSRPYRNGLAEMEDVLAHEITHCKKALLRAGIPKERVEEIVKNELLKKAQKGESERYIAGGDLLGPIIKDVPKMSSKMREEFYQILKNPSEYKSIKGYKFYDEELAEALLDKYPEFVTQYKDRNEAFTELCRYMNSFEIRFRIHTDTAVTKKWINGYTVVAKGKVNVSEVTGNTLKEAEQSLIEMIDTLEGNARISGLGGVFEGSKGFNQYQFSPEEVLAQKNGNDYLIESLTAKLKEPNISSEEQSRLQTLINQARATIEYKTNGQTYYKKYLEHINEPENEQLAEEVEALETKLFYLKEQAFPKERITETVISEYNEPSFKFNETFTTPFFWSYKPLENK